LLEGKSDRELKAAREIGVVSKPEPEEGESGDHTQRTKNEPPLIKRLKSLYRGANALSGGRLAVLRDALDSFAQARGSEAAAGMAYYAVFSLFPLLLALVAGGSFVLDKQTVLDRVVSLVSEAFPVSRQLITQNLQQIIKLRGPVGLVGLVGAIWSGSGVFAILSQNVNSAWTDAAPRNFLQDRLLALAMVGAVAVLLLLSLAATTLTDVLSRLQIPLGGGVAIYDTPLWTIASFLIPWSFLFLLFVTLYRWLPNAEVPWSAALWAGLVIAVIWQIAVRAFAFYVGSGLARYQVVYGSLGTIVALMFWIYVASWITFFGAHLSAAINRYERAKPKNHDLEALPED
jgi:membrane protein